MASTRHGQYTELAYEYMNCERKKQSNGSPPLTKSTFDLSPTNIYKVDHFYFCSLP